MFGMGTGVTSPLLLLNIVGDPYGIRTRVTAVKGRCLNHLTNGPYLAESEGFEPSVRDKTAHTISNRAP